MLAKDVPVELAHRIGFHPDPWQARIIEHLPSRLLLNCSRQTGKSRTVAYLAAVVSAATPRGLVLIVSGTNDQARNTYKYLRQDLAAMGVGLISDTQSRCELINGAEVVIVSPSGDRARSWAAPDLTIMDEASWIPDEVFQAVEPMLATKPDAVLAYASTPNGRRGEFYEAWSAGDSANLHRWHEIEDQWTRVQVTWEDCPRITRQWIADVESRRGRRYVEQEYGCQFVEAEDTFFRYADIEAAWSEYVPPMVDEAGLDLVSSAVQPVTIR